MAKANTITKEMAASLQKVAFRTWSAIAYDMPEGTDNEQALECVMDANYAEHYGGRKEEVAEWRKQLDELITQHGYDAMLKQLSKHIRLV